MRAGQSRAQALRETRREDHREKIRASGTLTNILDLQKELIRLGRDDELTDATRVAALGKVLDSRHKLLDKILPSLQAVAIDATVAVQEYSKEELEEKLRAIGVQPELLRIA